MPPILKALGDRLKAWLLTDAALDIEATLLARHADRVATLLVEAEHHDQHGCPTVATALRQQAEQLSLQRPLAAIQPALDHLQSPPSAPVIAVEPGPNPNTNNSTNGPGTRRQRLPRAKQAPTRRTG